MFSLKTVTDRLYKKKPTLLRKLNFQMSEKMKLQFNKTRIISARERMVVRKNEHRLLSILSKTKQKKPVLCCLCDPLAT